VLRFAVLPLHHVHRPQPKRRRRPSRLAVRRRQQHRRLSAGLQPPPTRRPKRRPTRRPKRDHLDAQNADTCRTVAANAAIRCTRPADRVRASLFENFVGVSVMAVNSIIDWVGFEYVWCNTESELRTCARSITYGYYGIHNVHHCNSGYLTRCTMNNPTHMILSHCTANEFTHNASYIVKHITYRERYI
jgi:hypothetical protein